MTALIDTNPPSTNCAPNTSAMPLTSAHHPTELCRYAGKRCVNVRAKKRNGEQHSLCHTHRMRANQNQRRMERKRRLSRTHKGNARTHATTNAHIAAFSGVRASDVYDAYIAACSIYASPRPSLMFSHPFASMPPPHASASITSSDLANMGDIDVHLGWNVIASPSPVGSPLHHHLHYLQYQQQQRQHASYVRCHHHHHHHGHYASEMMSTPTSTPADCTLEAIVEPVLLDDASYLFGHLSSDGFILAKDCANSVTSLGPTDACSSELELASTSESDMWTVPDFLLTL